MGENLTSLLPRDVRNEGAEDRSLINPYCSARQGERKEERRQIKNENNPRVRTRGRTGSFTHARLSPGYATSRLRAAQRPTGSTLMRKSLSNFFHRDCQHRALPSPRRMKSLTRCREDYNCILARNRELWIRVVLHTLRPLRGRPERSSYANLIKRPVRGYFFGAQRRRD